MAEAKVENRVRLTDKKVSELAPGAKLRYVMDAHPDAPRGFGVWITPAGARTFFLYRKVAGKPTRILIGSANDLPLELARKEAFRRVVEIHGGKNPQAERRMLREQATLGELLDRYIDKHLRVEKRTADAVAGDVKRYFGRLVGKKLRDVTQQDVSALHKRLGEERGPYTANRQIAMLRACINWAITKGEIRADALASGENPAKGVTMFKEDPRNRPLKERELARFFEALNREHDLTTFDLLRVALLTGARMGNILQMRWASIDLEAGVWTIPAGEAKAGKEIVLPLADDVLRILYARKKAGGEYVFPAKRKGKRETPHLVSIKRAWRRVLNRARLLDLVERVHTDVETLGEAKKAALVNEKKALAEYEQRAADAGLSVADAGLPRLRFHDLRHTLGSWQASAGESLLVIGKALGHRSAAATRRYAHVDLEPVRQANERAAASMLIAAGERPAEQPKPAKKRA